MQIISQKWINFLSYMPFVQEQEILAWKGNKRGSKRGSSEELELDLIEVLEEEEEEEESKEGSEKLSRTESSKSFDSFGEEVPSNYFVSWIGCFTCMWIIFSFSTKMTRGHLGRKKSKKKSACSTFSNSSDQVYAQALEMRYFCHLIGHTIGHWTYHRILDIPLPFNWTHIIFDVHLNLTNFDVLQS